jgi:diaminopropionate ammonia-lyase
MIAGAVAAPAGPPRICVRFVAAPQLTALSMPEVAWGWGRPSRDPLAFHRCLPGYVPTPLVRAPVLARRLGVGRVYVKDESHRLGLPAFKILGASWAVYRAIRDGLGLEIRPWSSIDALRDQVAALGPRVLVTATDGNHGRAVARIAAWLGWSAHVFVPGVTAKARIAAIRSEGADVTLIDGSYDDAVAAAARRAATQGSILIADTAQTADEVVPQWVIEGYSTIFWEVDESLEQLSEPGPDVVAIQMGVGALAAAAVRHYQRSDSGLEARPRLVGIEPERAACVLSSVEAGQLVTLPGQQDSIMAGLNCGTPSPVAWPLVSRGIDLYLCIEDEQSREAMRALAVAGLVSGETGAAGLGGLLALVDGPAAPELRALLGLHDSARVLVVSTEGATDAGAYEQIVGRPPHEVERELE